MTVTIKAWALWSMYLVLSLYCIVDAYHTERLLSLGARELNPIINWLVGVAGTWKIIYIAKLGILTFLGIMLATHVKRKEKKALPEGREMRHYSYY